MDFKILLPKEHTYILAVSGGVDSMVLLDYLAKNNYQLVVVHFNHQKRADAHLDHALVESTAQLHKIPYHYIKLSIKTGNFQESARTLRLTHLEKIAEKYQTPYIVTAHHADDLAETILMKLIRGSNLLGYAAMQEKTVLGAFVYLKPLLKYAKHQLLDYAKAHQIAYLEDVSNLEDTYFRNRIRHHIMPILKDENEILAHFSSFSEQAFLASDYIRNQTKSFLKPDLSFSLSLFKDLHDALKMDVISFILESVDAVRSHEKIKTILKQLLSPKPNVAIKLSKDFSLIKAYDSVVLITPNKETDTDVAASLMISHKKDSAPNNWVELCYNELDFPIVLRGRLPGDLLSFPYGRKKLKSYLIEKKIPMTQRKKLLIAVDKKNTILWIPGLYINQTLGESNKIYLSIKE